MHDAPAASRPLIHRTPPTDRAFLASVARSYADAREFLSREPAVYVGTLVRLREDHPMASIIPIRLATRDAAFVLWLAAREGWTEIEPGSSAGPRRP